MLTSVVVPYLLSSQSLAPFTDRLSLAVVGSVAAGFCTEESDLDIAVVCPDDVLSNIPEGATRQRGKPSEIDLDGVPVQYYGTSYREVSAGVRGLDDAHIYNWQNAVVLHDPSAKLRELLDTVFGNEEDLRRQRLEGKLDMLIRRERALGQAQSYGDPLVVAKLYLEVMSLLIKVVALLDDQAFDPRKRLFITGLSGPLGARLSSRVSGLFQQLGQLTGWRREGSTEYLQFLEAVEQLVEIVKSEAEQQGFRVGLAKPDHRASEP